jgi:hypothetical protein
MANNTLILTPEQVGRILTWARIYQQTQRLIPDKDINVLKELRRSQMLDDHLNTDQLENCVMANKLIGDAMKKSKQT